MNMYQKREMRENKEISEKALHKNKINWLMEE